MLDTGKREDSPKDWPKDWVGEWFPIIESQGEYPYVGIGKVEAGEPEWEYLSHQHFDGIGAFGSRLREEGYALEKLPRQRSGRPDPITGVLASLHYLWDSRLRRMPWKKLNPEWTGRSCGVAWHVFTEEETSLLLNAARAQGASLNTLLLLALDRSVSPELVHDTPSRRWLIPVNMRDAVEKFPDTSNHASYIGIDIKRADDGPKLQRRIERLIRWNSHWAVWWSVNIGRWIGYANMKRSLEYYRRNRHSWMGTLSNLGVWDLKHPGGARHSWIFAVPVSQGHPIGASCVTFQGRLSVALQLHPVLTTDFAQVRRLHSLWRSALRAFL